MQIVDLSERTNWIDRAARWFSAHWGIPEAVYRASMRERSVRGVPKWFLALDEGGIAGGLGVIDNDFHRRRDLTPNICAVYVEERARGKGLARALLNHACAALAAEGWAAVYLLTDHERLYERMGWEFIGMAEENGGGWARVYMRRLEK